MLTLERVFVGVDTIVDDIHDLFRAWGKTVDARAVLGEFGLDVMTLAVHEWIGNLIQHADFGSEAPLIRLAVSIDGDRVRCVVEDNSRGFDFLSQLVHQRDHLESALLPPERGRGLLLMIACTENLHYGPLPSPGAAYLPGPLYHRLEFWVSPRSTSRSPVPMGSAFDPRTGTTATSTHPSSEPRAPGTRA